MSNRVSGTASMQFTTIEARTLLEFLQTHPDGKVSISTSKGDYNQSDYHTLTLMWSYDLEERNREDEREMLGT